MIPTLKPFFTAAAVVFTVGWAGAQGTAVTSGNTEAKMKDAVNCCKKTSDGSKDCVCKDVFKRKDCAYCGYIVHYDPCDNCTRIYKHNCNKIKCCNGNYKRIDNETWKSVKQVRVGAPVQLYVNNLNFLKYTFNAESGTIEAEPGDPGMFNALANALTKGFTITNVPKIIDSGCTQNLQAAIQHIDNFKSAMGTLVASFRAALYGEKKDNCNDDCSASALYERLETFKTTTANKEGYTAFALNPAGFIQSTRRANFDAFYAKLKQLKEDTNCKEQIPNIDNALTTYAAVDSSLSTFVTALSNTYPLPDRDYQYNVPKVKNVDYLVFKLNLKGKDDKRNYRLNMHNEEIHIPVRCGVRVDFSTGPYLNFFNTAKFQLKPDTIYTTTATATDSVIRTGSRIVSDNKKFFPHFGVATMLHVYPRQLPYFSASPAFGVALNTDLSYSFLAGCSFILGRVQRASLSIGVSYNAVKELSNANTEGDFVASDYAIKTNTKFNPGLYLSLGYNIGLTPKKSTSQSADAKTDEKKEEKK
ncbi:MAG: hypothetical protein KIS94_09235 [Chitinophagales bacterium]|nr:hypothetical protein [Chitinophagales bacterium]